MNAAAGRVRGWIVWAAVFVASPGLAQSNRLDALGDGEPVEIAGVGNAELSGITWVGGTRYLTVDDGIPRIVPLDVTLDAKTSAIAQITPGDFVSLEAGKDCEGIAWLAKSETVLVTDESTSDIREYDPKTGKLLHSVAAPPPYPGRMSKNYGFESITVSADGAHVFIGNEGVLRLDGQAPTALEGAWLRIQRLDAALRPEKQWAYRTEPGLGFVGLTDLLATPTGELFALERSFTGTGFAARIFEVDVSHATEVSKFEKLRNRSDFTPAKKTKLWERKGGFQNFEGITVGPELPGGGRLVLLVSDGGARRPPTLLALRLVHVAAPLPPAQLR